MKNELKINRSES